MPLIDIDNKKNTNPYPSLDQTNVQQNLQSQPQSQLQPQPQSQSQPQGEQSLKVQSDVNEHIDPDGVKVTSKPFGSSPTTNPENGEEPEISELQDKPEVIPQKADTVFGVPEVIEDTKETEAPVIQAPAMNQAVKQEPNLQESELQGSETTENKVEPIKVIEPATPEIDEIKDSSKTDSIEGYLSMAIEKDASDVHFTVGYPVYFRVDGSLQRFGTNALSQKGIEDLLFDILDEEQKDKLAKKLEIDMMYQHSTGNRFRVNIYHEHAGISGAFRLIPKTVKTIDELGLPDILKEFSKVPYGLVVVTGPTGSGKSTTIASMIEEINRTEARHIITIEDPVEYIYEKRLALIAQRNMYDDTQDWKNALRAVLRQDPNVVVIGEMRDYETIAAALTIAETGHLVFATLHTNSAAQTINRIIDVFPEGQQNQIRSQLSSMLSGVISQRLLPIKNGGRKAAIEILIGTIAVKNAIRENKVHQIDNIIQTSSDVGMVSLEKALVELIRSGDIDVQTAKNFSSKPDEIDLLMR